VDVLPDGVAAARSHLVKKHFGARFRFTKRLFECARGSGRVKDGEAAAARQIFLRKICP
jgi:hypothetical protein